MKKIILFSITFLFGAICDGQALTFAQFQYVLLHNFDESRDFLLNDGFNIEKLYTPVDNYPEYYYIFHKNKGLDSIIVEKKSYETNAFTYSQDEYLYLKKSVQHLGFNLDSTVMQLGQYPMYFYHKENLQITFVMELLPNNKHIPNNTGMISGYYISLSDIKIKNKHNPMDWEW